MALAATENAQEDVLGADRRLSQRLRLFAGQLDAAAGFAGDQDLRPAALQRVERVLGEMAVLAVGGLLADAERPRDLAPGSAGLQGALDQTGFDLLQLLS